MKYLKFTALAFVIISVIVISGCTSPDEPNQLSENKIIFVGPQQTLQASVNQVFSYSFCKPDVEGPGATCGGLKGTTTDPTGGKPPYSFEARGILPPGLALNLNGLLAGTPTLKGTYNFQVCAKDLYSGEDCEDITIDVIGAAKLEIRVMGEGLGTVIWDKSLSDDCRRGDIPTCILGERLGDTVILTNELGEDTIFVGWSGACSGTGDCVVKMNEDKIVIMTLAKRISEETPPIDTKVSSVTRDVAECKFLRTTKNPYGPTDKPIGYFYYDYFDISFSGTAMGPIGTNLVVGCYGGTERNFDDTTQEDIIGPTSWTGSDTTFVRGPGDPETTTWSCYRKNYEVYRGTLPFEEAVKRADPGFQYSPDVGAMINWDNVDTEDAVGWERKSTYEFDRIDCIVPT